MSFPNT